MREREAFQELDYRAVFGTIAKWATEIDDPSRIPEIVSRAFHTACNGRPGPVVIALPEDMLRERVSVADAAVFAPTEITPGKDELNRLQEMLAEFKTPGGAYRRQPLDRECNGRAHDVRRTILAAGCDDFQARASV